jgi:hypothetical protein
LGLPVNDNGLGFFDIFFGLLLGLLSAAAAGLGAVFTTLGDVFFELFTQVVEE